jgi:hypothetical protein
VTITSGCELGHALRAHIVQRAARVDEVTHGRIDRDGCGSGVDRARRDDVTRPNRGREIAFVRHADDVVEVAERGHDLRGGREEGDDAHA